MKVAILGASGHLSKCAFWAFSQNKENEFYLFSRSMIKLEQVYDPFQQVHKTYFDDYKVFAQYDYDVIFNGAGSWDSREQASNYIFEITETFDNLILKYQASHPQTTAIHISSGAAYANDFLKPVGKETKTAISLNQFVEGDYYSVAKLNSEAKHRAFRDRNIVDIRLFGFFSRYMSLDYPYLMSAMIRAAKEKRVFKTVSVNFWRDYIHMEDFAALLYGIVNCRAINTAIDVRSKSPISKEELIQLFVNQYNLKVETDVEVAVSKTGLKPYYYSEQPNKVYTPRFSSLEAVEHELKYFMG